MKRSWLRSCLAALAICSAAHPIIAADWRQFRGPNGGGVSSDSGSLPVQWAANANLAWKSELPGAGVSSPIVVGEKVFVTCYSGYGLSRDNPGDISKLMRHLICIDLNSGKKLWQRDLASTAKEDPYTGIGVTAHGYASHTPVSDGKHVFCFFGKGGVHAFDLEGEKLWEQKVGSESDPRRWGSSSSPVLYNDTLIVTAAAESQAIVGLNAKTGNEVWRQEAAGLDNTWGTPVLVKIDDARTDLVLSVPKELWGLDPSTGKLRWYCEASGADQTHSSAISNGKSVFAFTGRGGGSIAVSAGGSGDVTENQVMWTGRDSARFGSPVSLGSKVYLVANGILTVLDQTTGKKVDQARLRGGSQGGGRFGSSDYASPVIGDGKLYYTNGSGSVYVFDVSGDKVEQLAVNQLATSPESFGGSPAITNGKIILRSNKSLYCVSDKGDKVEPAEMPEATSSAAERGNSGGRRGGRGGAPGGGGQRRAFDPAAFFKTLDKNGDGKVTPAEMEGSPMASRFSSLDKDENKEITLQEFQDNIRSLFGGNRGGSGGRGGYGQSDNRPKRPQRPQMSN